MRLALTCNGPGEFSGWVRPLARRFAELAPDVELHCFFVPDDYATGRESGVARDTLPTLHIHEPKEYVKFALGGKNTLGSFDGVLYLGGDILHARRIHHRLGGAFFTYRFAPRSVAKFVRCAFALDARNAAHLARTLPQAHIERIGNLAVDGAHAEVAGPPLANDPETDDGVLIMPGSRRQEIVNLVPFFATVAQQIRLHMPKMPVAFGISPFTDLASLDKALQPPHDRRLYARPGRVRSEGTRSYVVMDGTGERFPIVRTALQTALRSRIAVTIPGTKCIELASLGVPTIVCVPFNMPERAVINGPLTYLDRVPVFGMPLKRAAVLAFAGRFRYFAQPNIDAQTEIDPELVGTLTPGYVAEQALRYAMRDEWRQSASERLRAVYAEQMGATDRMVRTLVRELQAA